MLSSIKKKLSAYTWDIAYGKYDEEIMTKGVNWEGLHIVRNPYKTKWFADPFILTENNDAIQFLVEEFDSNVKKGRIARIVVDKAKDEITECHIILELPTHLSFPSIYRIENEIYVHPENSASGKSTIYRYDVLEDKLVEPIVLVNAPLTDAIIRNEGGRFFMYATEIPKQAGPKLAVFDSESILLPFKKMKEIDFGNRTARMAGQFLKTSNGEIRPAQDCIYDYGEAVLFYKEYEKMSEIRPKGWRYEGLHTFNTFGTSFVIDLKKYDYAWVHYLLKTLVRKLK